MPKNTSEKFEINHSAQPPGLFKRLAAIFYDCFLLLAVFFVVTALLLPLNSGRAFDSDQYYFPIILMVIGYIFFGWFWTHGGQTLGMRAWNLKLTTENNQSINWQVAAYRYLAACLSWLLFGLGFFWIVFDANNKAWHDYLSKTKLTKL